MATHPFLKARGLHLKRSASLRLLAARALAAGRLPNEEVGLGVADSAVSLEPILAPGIEDLAASERHAVAAHDPASEGCQDLTGQGLRRVWIIEVATAHLVQELVPEIGRVLVEPGAVPEQLWGSPRLRFRRHELLAQNCARCRCGRARDPLFL